MPEPNPVMGLAISGVSPSAIAVSASVTWSCASSGKRPNSLSAPLIHEMLRKAFRCIGANVVIFHNTVKLRSEAHTSELQSLIDTSYAIICLTKKINKKKDSNQIHTRQDNYNN